MRYGKGIVCIITLLFFAVAILVGLNEVYDQDWSVFSVVINVDNRQERIECVEIETGKYYLFLPSYAQLENCIFDTHGKKVAINGVILSDEVTLDAFDINVENTLSLFDENDWEYCYDIIIMQSKNIPSVHITLTSEQVEYLDRDKNNKVSGDMRVYTAEGTQDYTGNLGYMKCHGNSTWLRRKKSFNIELLNEAGLLGLGNARKWVLLANDYDLSHLRNKIVYDFARRLGMEYSPDCEWVDLYLDGQYHGIYLLSEKNEVHRERVGISGSGRFFVSMEDEEKLKYQRSSFFQTHNGVFMRVHDASMDKEQLKELWQSAENAILSEDSTDMLSGKTLQEIINIDSWVNKYLIEEVFANVDGCAYSQFFYRSDQQTGGLICAGPVWDYDKSMGLWPCCIPEAMYANRSSVWRENDGILFHTLYKKESFECLLKDTYEKKFIPLLTQLVDKKIDDYAQRINCSVMMNEVRWGYAGFQEEVEEIKTFLSHRMEFLERLWLQGDDYCLVEMELPGDGYTGMCFACYAVKRGDILPDYIQNLKNKCTWYDADSNEIVDVSRPIYENSKLKMDIKNNCS